MGSSMLNRVKGKSAQEVLESNRANRLRDVAKEYAPEVAAVGAGLGVAYLCITFPIVPFVAGTIIAGALVGGFVGEFVANKLEDAPADEPVVEPAKS